MAIAKRSVGIAQLFQNLHDHLPINFAENLITSLDTSQLWLLDFDESGAQIKDILESTYTDGITGLEGVENDGKQITGVFLVEEGRRQRAEGRRFNLEGDSNPS